MRVLVSIPTCVLCCLTSGSTLIAQDEDDKNQAAVESLRVVAQCVRPSSAAPVTRVVRYGLTRDDYRRIKKLAGDNPITPIREVSQNVRVGQNSVDANLIGTSPDYARAAGSIEQGRFLTANDLIQLNNVAVLSNRAAHSLFPRTDPIGKNVRVGKNYYLIVGVAEEGFGRGSQEKTEKNRKPNIYIPISTMRSRMGDQVIRLESGTMQVEEYQISRIEVDVPVSEADRLSVAIGQLLRQSHESQDYQLQIQSPGSARRTP